jgi:hypothetical protein
MKHSTMNAAPRVGKELVLLSTILYDTRVNNITLGIRDNHCDYDFNDLNNMWWPYGK